AVRSALAAEREPTAGAATAAAVLPGAGAAPAEPDAPGRRAGGAAGRAGPGHTAHAARHRLRRVCTRSHPDRGCTHGTHRQSAAAALPVPKRAWPTAHRYS